MEEEIELYAYFNILEHVFLWTSVSVNGVIGFIAALSCEFFGVVFLSMVYLDTLVLLVVNF